MTFNSFAFLIFFALVTPTYFYTPHRFRWILLALASCFFYMYWNPWLISIIFLTVTIDYYVALGIEKASSQARKRGLLTLSVLSNMGILGFFKYTNFLIQSADAASTAMGHPLGWAMQHIILPIGISFHTFQALSYTIDVYRGEIPIERHYGHYLLYVLFYPQLVSGPIERARNFLPQLKKEMHFDYDRVVSGLQMMLWGFFKKCVIADGLAEYVNNVYNHPHDNVGFPMLIGTWFFAFQIYCDFSGYTDIAIGAARVMGFTLMKNFNRPYIAASVAEFWHRWHISLSTWFRDYLYKPLGGNRVSQSRWILNVMTVFVLSGLWHGANWTFVVWGALHGVYLLLERWIKLPFQVPRWLSVIFTFNLVSIGWIFFRAASISDAWFILTHIGLHQHSSPMNGDMVNLMFLLIAFMLAVEARLGERTIDQLVAQVRQPLRWAWTAAIITVIILMVPEAPTTFIYFQF
ncbi:MAG: MBOAT family O-acyltransferase [Candidatus Xenobia bacterium]